MTTKPKLTVAIPTSEMPDRDHLFKRCLDSLWNQSLNESQLFEIVVTDNSDDDGIEVICDFYKTGIKYFKNPVKGMAQNTNEAIRRSTGDIIKILYMDDFMAHDKALEDVVENFAHGWLVTGCTHSLDGENRFNTHYPEYNDQIYLGNNTIGSPSVLTILNDNPLYFDEEMTWLLDVDYYKRLHERYGPPAILDEVNVVIGIGDHQATHRLSDELKAKEFEYIKKKYE